MTTVEKGQQTSGKRKKKKQKQTEKPSKNHLQKTQTKAIPTQEEGHKAQAIMPVHKVL